jgi:hypothetical protein
MHCQTCLRSFALTTLFLTLSLSACGITRTQPAPTSAPSAGPSLLFEDDFSDAVSGWLEASDAGVSQGYRDGKLFFQVQVSDLIVWDNAGVNLQDFVLEVEARQVSGGPENSYGALVRYVDDGNFYRFDLTGDGYFAVAKLENEEWATLADWQPSEHVNPLGAINLIKIVCQGPKMTFYANGQELVVVEDDSFERGDVGLLASTLTDPNVEVEFDNLEIWEVE